MAEQLINGVKSIVILRSRSLDKVLLAITPGTVQPKPISIGTMLLPDNPTFLKSLSITNATLAIYPLSSSRERKKKRVTIIGKKFNTLPTPLNIPLIMSECKTSFIFAFVSRISTKSVSLLMPKLSKSDKPFPITLKVSQNTRPIIAMNDGIAVYLPVNILSILTLRACSLLS